MPSNGHHRKVTPRGSTRAALIPRRPVRTGAAQQVQQQRLGLVVAR
jgi:hypothetical protein